MKNHKRLIIVSHLIPIEKYIDGKPFLKVRHSRFADGIKNYLGGRNSDQAFNSAIWIGCADFDERMWHDNFDEEFSNKMIEIRPIFFAKDIYHKFYQGFSKSTLWPLFHYLPSFIEYDNDTFAAYEAVSKTYLQEISSVIRPGDTVWINDYQLLLLPGMLREQNPNLEIGFFLHTPFPSYEIFRLLHTTWKKKILEGILGADLIGFYGHQYVQHFLDNVHRILQLEPNFYNIPIRDRTVKADVFPAGIDFNKFHSAMNLPEVIGIKNKIRQDLAGKKILMSLGGLDYTDGMLHRLKGIERFLKKYPLYSGKIVVVIIIIPCSRPSLKFKEMKQMIEEAVGKINGTYSTLEWQPIIYRYTNLTFNELAAIYEISDVGLVTPLREGLTLIAKEYVAAKSENGVLIVSEWASATYDLADAVLVNPMDEDELADKINEALQMPAEIQKNKIKLLQRKVRQHSPGQWINDFFLQLFDIKKLQHDRERKYLTDGLEMILLNEYQEATSRLILLDYDGTLVPFTDDPQKAYPDEDLLRLLEDLTTDDKNDVTIISGRNSVTLLTWLGHLHLNLISEHGAGLRLKNGDWKFANLDNSWKPTVYAVLESFVKRTPGSFVEEKSSTLVWHYRAVELALGAIRSRELIEKLSRSISNTQLQIIDGNKVIEVKPLGIDKGSSAKTLLRENSYDFIMAFGDDKTDEDLFKEFKNKGYTIKIGGEETAAQYYLSDQKEAIRLLNRCVDINKKVVQN